MLVNRDNVCQNRALKNTVPIIAKSNDYNGSNHALMSQADRIIICPDNEPEGWNIYWRLNSYYQGHV